MSVDVSLICCELDILCYCGKRFSVWGDEKGVLYGGCSCGCYAIGDFNIKMKDKEEEVK